MYALKGVIILSSSLENIERSNLSELLANKSKTSSTKSFFTYLLIILPVAVLFIDIAIHLTLPNKQSFAKTGVYPALHSRRCLNSLTWTM